MGQMERATKVSVVLVDKVRFDIHTRLAETTEE